MSLLLFIVCGMWTSTCTDRFGAWSTDSGCENAVVDGNHTVCKCNQLGHFGVLFVRIMTVIAARPRSLG